MDGHFLPAGVSYHKDDFEIALNVSTQTIVSTNPVAAALDEANFRDPFLFKPERWLEKSSTDNLAASQPFSMGPRGCLGRR